MSVECCKNNVIWPCHTPEMLPMQVASGHLPRYAVNKNNIFIVKSEMWYDWLMFIFDLIFICFFISNGKVLFKWRGSVYKLIFKEMFVYMVLYFFLNVLYRTILVEEGWEEYRYTFESLKGIFRNYIAILIQNKINIINKTSCCQI